MKVTGLCNLISINKNNKITWKKISINLYCKASSIRAVQPVRNSQKCHLMSFPLTQHAPIIVDPFSEWFNIIIRFSIFPSEGIGITLPSNGTTSAYPEIKTLFPAWFNNALLKSRQHVYSWIFIRILIIFFFCIEYKNWIFLHTILRKR